MATFAVVVVGVTGVLQVVTAWLAGSVIAKLTPALGCVAPNTPVTVAVKVIGWF